jgi:hypothetical protein
MEPHMKKYTTFKITAAALLLVGIILMGAGFAMGGMKSVYLTNDGTKIIPSEVKIAKVDKRFENLSDLDVDLMQANLILEEGDEFRLSGTYDERMGKIEISDADGKLRIRQPSGNKFFGISNFGFSLQGILPDSEDCRLTLTYPKGTKFGDVLLNCDLGNVDLNELTASGEISVDISSGNLTVKDLTAKTIQFDTDLGDTECSGLSASDSAIFDTNSGDLTIDGLSTKLFKTDLDLGNCHLTDIEADNAETSLSSGDLIAKNFDTKNYKASGDLSSMRFSGSLTGNVALEISSGDLTFDLNLKEKEVSYNIDSELGDVTINGKNTASSASKQADAPKLSLTIDADLANIVLKTQRIDKL